MRMAQQRIGRPVGPGGRFSTGRAFPEETGQEPARLLSRWAAAAIGRGDAGQDLFDVSAAAGPGGLAARATGFATAHES